MDNLATLFDESVSACAHRTAIVLGDRAGDLARRDEGGWHNVVDLATDRTIRNGSNVYLREIEAVLGIHPVVSPVAVVGVPHSPYGEQMAAYEYSRTIEFVESLPMTATGKLLKRDLPTATELIEA